MKRTRYLFLAILGIFLTLPEVRQLFFPPPSPLRVIDTGEAFERLATLFHQDLERLGSASMSVTVPDDEKWRRIRREWGDPGYILVGLSSKADNVVYCFDRLQVTARADVAGAPLPLEPATRLPYLFSTDPFDELSKGCQASGLTFQARPGTPVRIRIETSSHDPLPFGRLIVIPNWPEETKDRFARLEIDDDIATGEQYARVLLVLPGVALFFWGVVQFALRKRKVRRKAS